MSHSLIIFELKIIVLGVITRCCTDTKLNITVQARTSNIYCNTVKAKRQDNLTKVSTKEQKSYTRMIYFSLIRQRKRLII